MSDQWGGPAPPYPHVPATGYLREPPPPNYLVAAIVTTILCCTPFGIVALVYANKVNNRWMVGDHAGALDASSKAKTWSIVAAVAYFVVIGGFVAIASITAPGPGS